MKKIYLCFLVLVCISLCLLGCKKESPAVGQTVPEDTSVTEASQLEPFPDGDLDYSRMLPESEGTADDYTYDNPEASDSAGESVIPGLRPLDQYKTKYFTERQEAPKPKVGAPAAKEEPKLQQTAETSTAVQKEAPKAATAVQQEKSEKKLTVLGWGPVGEIPANLESAEFYVEFSLPVSKMTALKNQDAINKEGEKIFTITPEVPGNYYWKGTSLLVFEAEDGLDPGVSYTLTVNPKLTAVTGQPLSGVSTFTTKAAPLALMSINPGATPQDPYYYYNKDGGLPKEDAKHVMLIFNYYVSQEDLYSALSIYSSGKKLNYSASGDFDRGKARVSKDGRKTSKYFLTINDALENKSYIQIKYNDRAGKLISDAEYKTLFPFELNDFERGGYGRSITFYFNQPVDERTILNAVKVKGKPVDSDHYYFSTWNNSLHLYHLDIKPGEEAEVQVLDSLKNKYGFNLAESKSFTLEGKDYPGYARFLDYGPVIMEAQFPHKLMFEYMNATGGSYSLSSPLKSDTFNIDTSARNSRQFVEIDLDPYLSKKRGHVDFNADITTFHMYDEDGPGRDSRYENKLELQVTDLAATVRYGVNKAVVMVRSMEKNNPVSGASVRIINKSKNYSFETMEVKTDKKGKAVIQFTPEQQKMLTSSSSSSWWDEDKGALFVEVKTEDDQVVFRPNGHSTWSSGVNSGYLYDALKSFQKTYLFCDRGVYKPGETITFKGIDRNRRLGKFTPYSGNYTIKLMKKSWNSSTEYETLSGTTSAAGGFHGSFVLPADLKPDEYCLCYNRPGEKEERNLYFTVAYFEPVKFQASSAIVNNTLYAGDTIQAQVAASYLAGGSLAGATYNSTWYKEASSFNPTSAALKNYTFGIYDKYEQRSEVASKHGTMENNGKLTLTCATGNDRKGIPYTYRVETYITDVSNQQISTTASRMVHPALYYIGLAKPKNINGYAKSGQKLEFPFVLAGADEAILADTRNVAGNLEYKLSREYWTYNYQNSVNSSIYSRWEKHFDVEQTGTVKASAKGTISLTPKNAGWYTLRVSGADSKGSNAVSDYYFYVTGSGASWYSSESASMRLTPDQTMYNPGDTAHVLLESALPAGDYLVTVERDGIFTENIYHFDEPCNVIDVKIASDYIPVVYLSVSTYSVRHGMPVHKYGEADLDKPKSYYGVTSLFVNPQVKAFSIKAELDKKKYRPGDTAVLTLTATKGGKPVAGAELTALAADRAVLDLINYHIPNPIEFFYDTYDFPLRVKGGDSRDYLMDPVTYSIKDLQGGDAASSKDEDEDIQERKDFRPTAFFEPLLMTDRNGKATCTFKVPDNLTTFRLTAVGVKDELLAIHEGEFQVQNPLNVQAVQPRRLRVRDTAECGVIVTNLENVAHDVTVDIEVRKPGQRSADTASGLITAVGSAFIDGKASHTVKVEAGRTSVIYFDVAAEDAGNVELVYKVTSDSFKEKLVSNILIEKSYCLEKVALSGSTDYIDNGKGTATEYMQIPGFAKDGVGSLKVTLDATRLGLLGGAVNYVFDYPYGCMEQQSSRIIPLVAFDSYIDVFGLDNRISDTRSLVKKYFADWKNIQHSNGGFPYWPNGWSESYYVSVRIAHIYAMALSRGYTPEELAIDIDGLKRYLMNSYSSYYNTEYGKAYACYVFSLLKDPGLDNQLNALDSYAKKNLDIAAFLGLAWANKGTDAGMVKAGEYMRFIRSYMRPELRSVDITQPENGYDSWYWYSDSVSQVASILQLFVTVNPDDPMVNRLLYSLLQSQRKGYWQSTATTARVLEAIYTLIKERKLDTTDFIAKAEIISKEILSCSFKGAAAKPVEASSDFDSDLLRSLPRDTDIRLDFSAQGTGTLYYTAELAYALPDEVQTLRNEGLDVSFSLSELEGGKKIPTEDLLVPLESGVTYKAVVTIYTAKDRDHVALRVPIPSGAEVLDSTFVTSGSKAVNGSYDYDARYIYDNEVQYFWDDIEKGRRVRVEFTFRAARRGVYPVTPVLAECMYEPEVFGRGNGYLYTIK